MALSVARVSFGEDEPLRPPHNSNTGWHPTAAVSWELTKGRGRATD